MKKLEKQPSSSTTRTPKNKSAQVYQKVLENKRLSITGPVPSEGAKTTSNKSSKISQAKDQLRGKTDGQLIPLHELIQTVIIECFTTISLEAEKIHPLFSMILVLVNFFLAAMIFNAFSGYGLSVFLTPNSQTTAVFSGLIVTGAFGIWTCAFPPIAALLQADRTEPLCLRMTKDYLGLLMSTERTVRKKISAYCLQLCFYVCAPFSLAILLMHLTIFLLSAADVSSIKGLAVRQSLSAFVMALMAAILNVILAVVYSLLVDTTVPNDGYLSASSRTGSCLMFAHLPIIGILNVLSYANSKNISMSWALHITILAFRIVVPATGLYQTLKVTIFFNWSAMYLYTGGFLAELVCVLYYFLQFVENRVHPRSQRNFIASPVLMIGIMIGTRVLYNCRPRADSMKIKKDGLTLRDILLCIHYFKTARKSEITNNWDVLGYYMLVMTRDLYPHQFIEEFLSAQIYGEQDPHEPTYQGVAFIMHLFDLLGKKLSHGNLRHLKCEVIIYQLHFLVSLNFNMRSLGVLLARRKKIELEFFTLFSLIRLEKVIREKIKQTNLNKEKLSFDVEGDDSPKQINLLRKKRPRDTTKNNSRIQLVSLKNVKKPAATQATVKPSAQKLQPTPREITGHTTEDFEANPNLHMEVSMPSQNTEDECVQIMEQLQQALESKDTGRRSSVSVLRLGDRGQDAEYFMLNNSFEVRTEYNLDLYQYMMTQRITERFVSSLDRVVQLVLEFFELLSVARPALPAVHKMVGKIAYSRVRVEHLFSSLNSIHSQLGCLSASRLYVLTYSYFMDQVFSDKQLSLSLLKDYKNASRLEDPLLSAVLTNPVVGDVYVPLEENVLMTLDAQAKNMGAVLWSSRASLVSLGIEASQIVGRNIHDLIPEEFRVSHFQRMEQVCRGGTNEYFSTERLRYLRTFTDRNAYMRALMQVQISPSISNGLNFLTMLRCLKIGEEFLVFSQSGELLGYCPTLGPGSRIQDFSKNLGESIEEFSPQLHKKFMRFVYNELNDQSSVAGEEFINDAASKGISLELFNNALEEEIYLGSDVAFKINSWEKPLQVNATFKSAKISGTAGDHHLEVYVMLKFPKEASTGKSFGINLTKFTKTHNEDKNDSAPKRKDIQRSTYEDFSVLGIKSDLINRLEDEQDDSGDKVHNGGINSLKKFEIGIGILSKVYNINYAKKIKQLSNLMENHITKGIQKDQEDRESVVSSINSTVHREKINFIRTLSKRRPLFRYMLWLLLILVLFLVTMIYGLAALQTNFVDSLQTTIVGRSVVRLVVLLDSFLQSGTVVLNYLMLDSIQVVPDNPFYFGSLGINNIPRLTTEFSRIISDLGDTTEQLLIISKHLTSDQWSMYTRYSKQYSPVLLETPTKNYTASILIDFSKVAFEGLSLLNQLNNSYRDVGFSDYRVNNLKNYLEQIEEDVTLKTLVDFYDSEKILYQQRQSTAAVSILIAEIMGTLLGLTTLLILILSKLKMNMIYFGLSKVANFEILFKKDSLHQLAKTISKTRDSHEVADAVATASELSRMVYREYKNKSKQGSLVRRVTSGKHFYFGLAQMFFPICIITTLSPLILLIFLRELTNRSSEYISCLSASKEHLLLFYRSNVFATQATWVEYIKAGVVADPDGSKLNYSLTQLDNLIGNFTSGVHLLREFTDSTPSTGIYAAFEYLKRPPIQLVSDIAPAERILVDGTKMVSGLAANSFGTNTLSMHEYQSIKYKDLVSDLKSVGGPNSYDDVGAIVFSDSNKEMYLIQRFFMRYIVDAFQLEFIKQLLAENSYDSQQLRYLFYFVVVVSILILVKSIIATCMMKREASVSMSCYSLLAFDSFTENTLLKAHTNLLKQL